MLRIPRSTPESRSVVDGAKRSLGSPPQALVLYGAPARSSKPPRYHGASRLFSPAPSAVGTGSPRDGALQTEYQLFIDWTRLSVTADDCSTAAVRRAKECKGKRIMVEPDIVPCRLCSYSVARDTPICPSCGTEIPWASDRPTWNPQLLRWFAWVGGAVLLILLLLVAWLLTFAPRTPQGHGPDFIPRSPGGAQTPRL